MHSLSNYPINGEESLVGRLTLGLRNLTTKDLHDLVIFSEQKTSWLGKVWVAIKLILTGKGIITDQGIISIIRNNPNQDHHPNMDRLIRIHKVAQGKFKEIVQDKIKATSTTSESSGQLSGQLREGEPLLYGRFYKEEYLETPIAQPSESTNSNTGKHGRPLFSGFPPKTGPEYSTWAELHPEEETTPEASQEHSLIQPQEPNLMEIPQLSEEKLIEKAWYQLDAETNGLIIDYLKYNPTKSRFHNVLCPRETAVTIINMQGMKDYIHANHVGKIVSAKKCFIAAEAPYRNAYRNFWKAVFNEVDVIIDLTNQIDHDVGTRGGAAATVYTPTLLNDPLKFDDMTVTLIDNAHSVQGNTVYTYELKDEEGNQKPVFRINYVDWIDHNSVPVEQLMLLVYILEEFNDKNVLIHCRAGLGRTGTLITAAILKEKIISKEINLSSDLSEVIKNLILRLREERGSGFVQEIEQFQVLYDFAKVYLFC